MKKIKIIVLFAILLIMSACDSNKIENQFESSLTKEQIKNDYEIDDSTYGVFLSVNSKEYYQYKSTSSCTVINIIGDRIDVLIDDTLDESPLDILVIYYYVKADKKLYKVDPRDGIHTEVSGLTDDSIKGIATHVSIQEGYSGELVTYDYLYPMLNGYLEDVNLVSSTGSSDITNLKFTLSKEEFIEKLPILRTHITALYDYRTVDQIMKVIESTISDEFYFTYYWNSSEEVLLPYFSIKYQNYTYYEIGVKDYNFAYELPKCN